MSRSRRLPAPAFAVVLAAVHGLAAAAGLCPTERAAADPPQSGMTSHPAGKEGLDCSACHTETGWQQLGSRAPDGRFDHDRTGFPLRGRHARAACSGCHQRGVALTRRCNGCHEDAHQGRLAADCSGCHGADTWVHTNAIAEHRKTRLPLTGMHALLDCSECHRRGADRTWSSLPANCYACHADDYRRTDIHPPHVGSLDGAPPLDRDCGACHRAFSWSPAIIPVDAFSQALSARTAFDHDRRFVLSVGPHRDSTCNDCHADEQRRGPVRCIGCHAHDPERLRRQHRGAAPAPSAVACLACHPAGTAR